MNTLEIVEACFHKFDSAHSANAVGYVKELMAIPDPLEWASNSSEKAVLITTTDNVMGQCEFAQHVRTLAGGSDLYYYGVMVNEIVLLLSESPELADELTGDKLQFGAWSDAEKYFDIPEGSLRNAF